MKTNWQNENWHKARKYFGIEGKTDLHMHHKDPTLRWRDRERYDEWRPEDLEVLTKSEHRARHNHLLFQGENNPMYGADRKGEKNGNYGKKHPGLNKGEKNPMYGKPSPTKGKHWYNDGVKNMLAYECPEGYIPGAIQIHTKEAN